MATLQKLRNMGPVLVAVVGLALAAFVLGDAFRLTQSPQGSQAVGSVNGEEILATDYQKMYEEYSEVVKFIRQANNLSEEEMSQIKDQVWQQYLQTQILKEEAEKIGLTVSVAELQDIVAAGKSPLLQQTPFRNEQGQFDKSILDNFLVQYEQNKDNAEIAQQYAPMYEYWKFIEKTLMDNALAEKYQMLITNSFLSNSVAAQSNYEANNATYDIEVAAYPYSAVPEGDVKVSESDIQALYSKNKEQFKQPFESRDIKYVSYQVTPSEADRADLNNEMNEYAEMLKAADADCATIVRQANSEVPFSAVAWKKSSYPEEVAALLDETEVNTVVAPFYTQSNDSYTTFKVLGKATVADSVKYRQLAIAAATPEATATLADSILNALKGGSDFAEVAKKYNQSSEDAWLTSEQYEGMMVDGFNATFLTNILEGTKGEYKMMDVQGSPVKLIYQVVEKKNNVQKYNVAVIKRTAEFSKDTYSDAYNKFSEFVAKCKTVEDLEKNAEEYGYRVQPQANLYTASHKVAGQNGTRETLKWLFQTAKVGEVSPLYECGENDNLLVVALTNVNEKGYRTAEQAGEALRFQALNDKKAEKLIADLSGKNFEAVAATANVKCDTVKYVSFGTPAYISITASSEPAISAAVQGMQAGAVSAPIKGNNAVYVIRLIAKNAKDGEYNAQNEQKTLKSYAQRSASFFINDLMQQAEIEDNRYLYF